MKMKLRKVMMMKKKVRRKTKMLNWKKQKGNQQLPMTWNKKRKKKGRKKVMGTLILQMRMKMILMKQ